MKLDISLAPETLFYIGSLAISNSFFWLLVVSVFLLVGVFKDATRKNSKFC